VFRRIIGFKELDLHTCAWRACSTRHSSRLSGSIRLGGSSDCSFLSTARLPPPQLTSLTPASDSQGLWLIPAGSVLSMLGRGHMMRAASLCSRASFPRAAISFLRHDRAVEVSPEARASMYFCSRTWKRASKGAHRGWRGFRSFSPASMHGALEIASRQT